MSKIKVKTKKSAAKRYKITRNGKVMYPKRGKRHLLTDKNSKRKRKLRTKGILKPSEAKRAKKMLPYV